MSAPSTLAAERTLMARVRTAVAVLLTCAIVARAAASTGPAALCLAVAAVAVLTLRLQRGLAHAALVGCVLVLAAVGLAVL